MSLPLDTQQLDQLLRSCVECGLCLPSCATYLATGNESHSPRGRLMLLGEVLHERLDAQDPSVRQAFDHCLGCMACSATCPSGVSFDLLAHLQDLVAEPAPMAGPVPLSLMDRGSVLSPLRRAGNQARSLLRRLAGDRWRQRLDGGLAPVSRLSRLLGSLPVSPETDAELQGLLDQLSGRIGGRPIQRKPSVTGPHLLLFTGCADEHLLPGTARRLRSAFEFLGCEVTVASGQECCGALASHTARPERARHLQQVNLEAIGPDLARCDYLVVAAAGCGLELKSYPASMADKVIDAVVLLAQLVQDDLATVPLKVALHDPCHARHGQGIMAEPRQLLARIPGLELLEPAEADVCCGGAGLYGVQHPELSQTMGRRKAEILVDTGCDLVVTSNPGCLGQIADGLALVAPDIPILPLSDLVWYAQQGSVTPEARV